jgi:hypothetical protein
MPWFQNVSLSPSFTVAPFAIHPEERDGKFEVEVGTVVEDRLTVGVKNRDVDAAWPVAGAVYGAMDIPWAKLVGQIAQAYGK